jgi:hypothetical protein
MFLSMEVRWFAKAEGTGGIPPGVQAWFSGVWPGMPLGDGLIGTDGREDIYLSLPGLVDTGIKLRAGERVEIKRRLLDLGIREWTDGITGRVEQWAKWSFGLAGGNDPGSPITPADMSLTPGQWIVVHKLRQLRKWQVRPGDQVEPVSASAWPAEGCQLEITRLEHAGGAWWSLGFESFGSPERLEDSLETVMQRILACPGFPRLGAEKSYGYPEWLGVVLPHPG